MTSVGVDVRAGSKWKLTAARRHDRSTFNSGHIWWLPARPLSASTAMLRRL